MNDDLSDRFAKVSSLVSSPNWLQDRKGSLGMYYDLDGAINTTFHLDDRFYNVKSEPDGFLVAEIRLSRRVKNLGQLRTLFYRLWGKVSFGISFVREDIEEDQIGFYFITGTKRVGYAGRVIFKGDVIRTLIANWRALREQRKSEAIAEGVERVADDGDGS